MEAFNDDDERSTFTNKFKYPIKCNIHGKKYFNREQVLTINKDRLYDP